MTTQTQIYLTTQQLTSTIIKDHCLENNQCLNRSKGETHFSKRYKGQVSQTHRLQCLAQEESHRFHQEADTRHKDEEQLCPAEAALKVQPSKHAPKQERGTKPQPLPQTQFTAAV